MNVQECRKTVIGFRLGAIFFAGAFLGQVVLPAQEFRESQSKVSEFALPNGLRFIVMERHQAPVVSFHTLVNAGSAEDPAGQTGIAHMFEHLAFKGTESIGTRNWAAEKRALAAAEEVSDRLAAERNKGPKADQGRIAALELDLKGAVDAAQAQADPSEFSRAIQESGGVRLNARTTPDSSETSYSLPSNRMELWFLLESQRLTHPVFRDFYRERDAMLTEYRNNVETRALPKLQEALLATAIAAHPYRNPLLGWPSDAAQLRPADATAFFATYYVPGNMVMGIVGDVDPANVQRLAERYFGPIPAKPLPPEIRTGEPPQLGPKTVVLLANSANAQPYLLIAYKRPNETHRDDLAFDVIRTILADRTSGWLYKDLVEEKRIAQGAEAVATFPAGRYANLFVFSVAPAQNHTPEENLKALDAVLARFESKPVDNETLERVKNTVRGRIARVMVSNQELAALLPQYQAVFGDWRRLFATTGELNRLTGEDLQRVAAEYFTPANRTVAYITNVAQPGTSPAGQRGPQ
jgi:predicted Zn-dependent peptidase